jgi:hypothetical protein
MFTTSLLLVENINIIAVIDIVVKLLETLSSSTVSHSLGRCKLFPSLPHDIVQKTTPPPPNIH